jgi:hypothetical protein
VLPICHARRLHNLCPKRDYQPMSPPAEQLIRDYLNRLSVAARGQLGADDRRALVDRTRGFIERKTGLAGPPAAIEVARLLAGLGDPARLVQQERQRLAAVRGEMPEPATGRNPIAKVLRRDSGKSRTASWHWPVLEGGRADLQLTLLDSDSAAGAHASGAGQQPEVQQSEVQQSEVQQSEAQQSEAQRSEVQQSGVQQSAAEQSGAQQSGAQQSGAQRSGEQQPTGQSRAQQSGAQQSTRQSGPQPSGAQRPANLGGAGLAGSGGNGSNGARNGVRDDGPGSADQFAPRVPAQSGAPDWFFRALGGDPGEAHEDDKLTDESAESGQTRPPWPLTGARGVNSGTREFADTGSAQLGDPAPTYATTPWQLTPLRAPVLSRHVRRTVAAAAAWYRRNPLEASAVTLLGLGGAIFPPVWLLGAVVALASRVWDGRDKWLGLALPVLLPVIAIAVGATDGGRVSMGHGVHEGWVYGVVASRIAALLSASYLAWRSVHGRRPPAVPPWNRPHKVG